MQANFPGVDFLGTVLKFRKRKKIWFSLDYIHSYMHTYTSFNIEFKVAKDQLVSLIYNYYYDFKTTKTRNYNSLKFKT